MTRTPWQRRPFTPPESDETILKSREVADWIGQSPQKLAAWRCYGGGPVFSIAGGRPIYFAGDVRAFIAHFDAKRAMARERSRPRASRKKKHIHLSIKRQFSVRLAKTFGLLRGWEADELSARIWADTPKRRKTVRMRPENPPATSAYATRDRLIGIDEDSIKRAVWALEISGLVGDNPRRDSIVQVVKEMIKEMAPESANIGPEDYGQIGA